MGVDLPVCMSVCVPTSWFQDLKVSSFTILTQSELRSISLSVYPTPLGQPIWLQWSRSSVPPVAFFGALVLKARPPQEGTAMYCMSRSSLCTRNMKFFTATGSLVYVWLGLATSFSATICQSKGTFQTTRIKGASLTNHSPIIKQSLTIIPRSKFVPFIPPTSEPEQLEMETNLCLSHRQIGVLRNVLPIFVVRVCILQP